MKQKIQKRVWLILGVAAALLLAAAVLFLPVKTEVCNDGGTEIHAALIYKIVHWNRVYEDGSYMQTKIYWGKDRFRSVDELWELYEAREASHTAAGQVLEIHGTSILLALSGEEAARAGSDQLSFNSAELEELSPGTGDWVKVTYTGDIMESYPPQIHAVSWQKAADLRNMPYEGEWIAPDNTVKAEESLVQDLVITAIYSDCFFAAPVIPMPTEILCRHSLSENWCVGDQIYVTYGEILVEKNGFKADAEVLSVEPSEFELEPGVEYKPVIYCYPEEKTRVSVQLVPDGGFTCTYPKYQDGWKVTAYPDGTLVDEKGQSYNYLYWEGKTGAEYDFSEGFCVRGKDTAVFLEVALEKLGLTRREANEFIIYWLPHMETNPYNIISFQTDRYTEKAVLNISPKPDTLIRVFMAFKPSEQKILIPEQELSAPERRGFTVVEWGGSRTK